MQKIIKKLIERQDRPVKIDLPCGKLTARNYGGKIWLRNDKDSVGYYELTDEPNRWCDCQEWLENMAKYWSEIFVRQENNNQLNIAMSKCIGNDDCHTLALTDFNEKNFVYGITIENDIISLYKEYSSFNKTFESKQALIEYLTSIGFYL